MLGLASLLAGLLFGAGLALAGMLDPAKVLNFLDVAGTFDPSLAVTMGAAVVVTFFGFRMLKGWDKPLFASDFHWPTARHIEPRLIIGPAVFGLGWGLAGICPGPAVASLALGNPALFAFLLPMLAGIYLAGRLVDARSAAPAGGQPRKA